jgi:hypothetical protein
MGNSPEICRKHYASLIPEAMVDEVELGDLPKANLGNNSRIKKAVLIGDGWSFRGTGPANVSSCYEKHQRAWVDYTLIFYSKPFKYSSIFVFIF